MDPALAPYLEHLGALPFIRSHRVSNGGPDADATVFLRTEGGQARLLVQVMTSHLTLAAAREVARRAHEGTGEGLPVVFAPYIGAGVGRILRDAGVNYVDSQGNSHLVLDRMLLVHTEGRKAPRRATVDRGVRPAGFQVLFAYLADEKFLDATVRQVAAAAGVSRQAVLDARRRLLDEGFVVESKSGIRWIPRRRTDALARWLSGYQTTVRPHLVLGTFKTPDRSPTELEARLATILDREAVDWRWGGTAAAFRLTEHYRGQTTTVHVRSVPANFQESARALPDPHGRLVLLGANGDLNWQPASRVVHPLLIHSEMLSDDDERAREAAAEVMDKYIRPGWGPRE